MSTDPNRPDQSPSDGDAQPHTVVEAIDAPEHTMDDDRDEQPAEPAAQVADDAPDDAPDAAGEEMGVEDGSSAMAASAAETPPGTEPPAQTPTDVRSTHDVDYTPVSIPRLPVALAGLVLLLGVVGVVYYALFPPAEAAYSIDGDDTSREQFAEEVASLAPDIAEVAATPEEATAEERSLLAVLMTGLIVEDVLTEQADELGLEVTAEAIDEELDSILADSFGGDEAAFDEAISSSGLSEAGVRQQIRTTLLVTALSEQDGGVEITDEQIQQFYDEQINTPTVSHILVETEEEAQDVLARLDEGEDFAAVASEVSIDPGSAQAGGQLGPYQPGTFVPEFEQAVESAEPGEVVGPVQTQFGFHVIRLEEPPPLEEVRATIEQTLTDREQGGAIQTLLQELDEELEVTVSEDYGTWVGLLQGGVQPPTPELDLPPGGAAPLPEGGEVAPGAEQPPGDGTDAEEGGDEQQ